MSLACARCGDCCDQIETSWGPEDFLSSIMRRGVDPDEDFQKDSAFIAEHWTCIARPEEGDFYVWVCDQFDRQTRLCGAPDRPPVCRNYPWGYGDKGPTVEGAKRLNPRCSLRLDVLPPAPGVLLPIIAVVLESGREGRNGLR